MARNHLGPFFFRGVLVTLLVVHILKMLNARTCTAYLQVCPPTLYETVLHALYKYTCCSVTSITFEAVVSLLDWKVVYTP